MRPRSSLCLLPLGCINPVLQLQHDMAARNAARADAGVADAGHTFAMRSPALATAVAAAAGGGAVRGVTGAATPATTSGGTVPSLDVVGPGQLRDSMNFDDFWCWCQSCKHGGCVNAVAVAGTQHALP